ncbi:hypothetical protein PR048_002506 [Dryococelus australis]|uniref:Uncharacterized protein n=1 Tax=Dryococelus australis TaxID=614101 RepID=A0ABQ9ILU7_9NEOP|nr:hypothetical protein PR048_002506 [Dryococelus australis]
MKTSSSIVPAPSDVMTAEPLGTPTVSSTELSVACWCRFYCKDFAFELTARRHEVNECPNSWSYVKRRTESHRPKNGLDPAYLSTEQLEKHQPHLKYAVGQREIRSIAASCSSIVRGELFEITRNSHREYRRRGNTACVSRSSEDCLPLIIPPSSNYSFLSLLQLALHIGRAPQVLSYSGATIRFVDAGSSLAAGDNVQRHCAGVLSLSLIGSCFRQTGPFKKGALAESLLLCRRGNDGEPQRYLVTDQYSCFCTRQGDASENRKYKYNRDTVWFSAGGCGSNPESVYYVEHLRFSQVGIVQDDAVGRRVFSGIPRFPRHGIPALLYSRLISPSSVLKTSWLRATQISQLNCTAQIKDVASVIPSGAAVTQCIKWGRSSSVAREPNRGAAEAQGLEHPIVGPQLSSREMAIESHRRLTSNPEQGGPPCCDVTPPGRGGGGWHDSNMAGIEPGSPRLESEYGEKYKGSGTHHCLGSGGHCPERLVLDPQLAAPVTCRRLPLWIVTWLPSHFSPHHACSFATCLSIGSRCASRSEFPSNLFVF